MSRLFRNNSRTRTRNFRYARPIKRGFNGGRRHLRNISLGNRRGGKMGPSSMRSVISGKKSSFSRSKLLLNINRGGWYTN